MPTLNARPARLSPNDPGIVPGKTPRFATVVLDVDSTLSGIEGIDWLAARRGDIVAQRVATLTRNAMSGAARLEDVYGVRLSTIRPRREDLDALSRAYVEHLAPGALEAIAELRRAGVQIVLMSGGLRHAMVRLAFHLGVDLDDVHAVDVRFDAVGAYTGFDASSILTTSGGKARLLAELAIDAPVLIVGDGITDLAMRSVTGKFAAFTGFVQREPVVRDADYTVNTFGELASLVLG